MDGGGLAGGRGSGTLNAESVGRWEPLGSAPEKSDLLPKYALAANNPTLRGIGDKGSGDVVGGGGATEGPGHIH